MSREARRRIILALNQEKWCSVSGSVVSLCVLAHSWRLHGRRKWKRMRIYTEVSAASTIVCALLLWAGYLMREDSWWRAILADTLAMSLFFVPSQYIDNVTFYNCAECVGGQIRNRALRFTLFAVILGVLYAWFPIYFFRGIVPSWYDEESDMGARLVAWMWYLHGPAYFAYNSAFGVFFIVRLYAMRRVKSSSEGRIFVLVLKTVIRVILSTGAVVFETYEQRIGSGTQGSLVYMVVTTLSIHVLFNTRIDGAMEKWLFNNYAFFQEEMRVIARALSEGSVSLQRMATLTPRNGLPRRWSLIAERIANSPENGEPIARRQTLVDVVKLARAAAAAKGSGAVGEDAHRTGDSSPRRSLYRERRTHSPRWSNNSSITTTKVHPAPLYLSEMLGCDESPLPPEGRTGEMSLSPRRETIYAKGSPRARPPPLCLAPIKEAVKEYTTVELM